MAQARCPTCGIKTVPWHDRITPEQAQCDYCCVEEPMERFDHQHVTKKTIMRHLSGKFRIAVYTK